jgi:hypothetical protein
MSDLTPFYGTGEKPGSGLDPDPDPYWPPVSNSGSGSGSGKNEYGSTTLKTMPIHNTIVSIRNVGDSRAL